MKYAALFIGDVEGNNLNFAGIIILPNNSYVMAKHFLSYAPNKNEVVLKPSGRVFCKDNYGKRHNWDPEYYNYKLILMSKAEVSNYIEERKRQMARIQAEIEYLSETYANVEDIKDSAKTMRSLVVNNKLSGIY